MKIRKKFNLYKKESIGLSFVFYKKNFFAFALTLIKKIVLYFLSFISYVYSYNLFILTEQYTTFLILFPGNINQKNFSRTWQTFWLKSILKIILHVIF